MYHSSYKKIHCLLVMTELILDDWIMSYAYRILRVSKKAVVHN